MNIIKETADRINKRLQETAKPCKSYATEQAAEKATAKIAQEVAEHHQCDRPAQYVVFYMESMGRWVGAIGLNELLSRADCNGGYLGFCADAGFYTF